MVKVLYLYESLRLGGGAEQLLLTTLKYLDRNKFTPLVYAIGVNGKIGEKIEKSGITVRALNKKIHLSNSIDIIYNLVQILRKENPDILHTNLFFSNIYGRIAAKIAGIKLVVTSLHNPDYTYENNGKWTFKIRKAIDKYTAKLCNTVFIAVSEFVKKDFEKQLGFKNIKVIYNCVDAPYFKKIYISKIEEKREEIGLKKDDIVLLNVGRLHPQKGQIFLIEAFSLICKNNPKYKLIIIGSGLIGDRLKIKVNDLNLSDSVIFLKDREDVREIMSACDIFVFPSLYEGFGIALVEAMAVGMPVIAFDIESLREIIRNNIDGALVEKQNSVKLAEAIYAIAQDNERRHYLGKNAKKRTLEMFGVNTYIKKLENFYQDMIYKTDFSKLINISKE